MTNFKYQIFRYHIEYNNCTSRKINCKVRPLSRSFFCLCLSNFKFCERLSLYFVIVQLKTSNPNSCQSLIHKACFTDSRVMLSFFPTHNCPLWEILLCWTRTRVNWCRPRLHAFCIINYFAWQNYWWFFVLCVDVTNYTSHGSL